MNNILAWMIIGFLVIIAIVFAIKIVKGVFKVALPIIGLLLIIGAIITIYSYNNDELQGIKTTAFAIFDATKNTAENINTNISEKTTAIKENIKEQATEILQQEK